MSNIGNALMVPVATLPVPAILIGIGHWIRTQSAQEFNPLAELLIKSGCAITDNMPVLFAIGIAFGLSRDKNGSAALTGFIAYLILTTLCSPDAVMLFREIHLVYEEEAFGHINNLFTGMLTGVISAAIYNRYSRVALPSALSFFNGRKLVPIITSFVMIPAAFLLMYIWPLLFFWLINFGEYIQTMGSVGAGIYAFFNRLLIPVGLHQALNSVFWFDIAHINDVPNFLGGGLAIEEGRAVPGVTGRYQAGFYPIMMFGLPGAALAIYRCAYPENRGKTLGIMSAAAFASFFIGITEPLELSFMFVAPVLYFGHALLTGLSVYISASMQWISGFGFTAGLVDFVLSSRNPLATNWWMLIPQGMFFSVIYYFFFSCAITRLNLKTPGRERQYAGNDDVCKEDVRKLETSDTLTVALRYIEAAGGVDNIVAVEACLTRLQLRLKDASMVNEGLFRSLGASEVIYENRNKVQIIVGFVAETIAAEMRHSVSAL